MLKNVNTIYGFLTKKQENILKIALGFDRGRGVKVNWWRARQFQRALTITLLTVLYVSVIL